MVKEKSLSGKEHLKKVFFTVLMAFAIVSFWRGVWGLMDLYLFPENLFLSFSLSVLIGIVLLYSTKNLVRNLI